MYFKQIVGHATLKQQLCRIAQRGNVAHAQLFRELGGTGALALAFAYARYLNCESRTDEDSCGVCASCMKYDQFAHPDLHMVFPIVSKKDKKKELCDDYLSEWREYLHENPYASFANWLSWIDAGNSQAMIYSRESESIVSKMSYKIYEGAYRVLLVWLPEKMHVVCSNKLLKLIEEPPAQTVILMVSETPELILPTILSRTQQLHVYPIEKADLSEALCREYQLEPKHADHVAHLAQGSYLRAIETISISEEHKFFLAQFRQIMLNAFRRDVKAMKQFAEEMAALGRERQKAFLGYSQHLLRENYILRFMSPDLNYLQLDEAEFSKKFSPFVGEHNVIGIMEQLALAEGQIMQNTNAKMVFFDLTLQLTVLIKKQA